jgi:hypothetical protein
MPGRDQLPHDARWQQLYAHHQSHQGKAARASGDMPDLPRMTAAGLQKAEATPARVDCGV